ncbi:DUF29 domain-containing protein [Endozoicomonas sp. 8E]|nr:DUF29 domain-containing protein [Endozoicomonas sp. 8E]WOG27987.1 DUF29 domain-containing protein [Endozoicomonas sp. 8E]
MENLYDTDFYTWCHQQAELIRQGRFNELDMDNLNEEVEDMGRARYRALESCLEQLFLHALKSQTQWKKDDLHEMDQWFRSWSISIGKKRVAILKELKKNPGLHNKLDEIFLTLTNIPENWPPTRCSANPTLSRLNAHGPTNKS